MSIKTLIADYLFDGNEIHPRQPVSFEDRHIIALDSLPQVKPTYVSGLLTAGFIDVQVNGGGGVLFNQQPTIEGITTIAKTHQQFGTTALLPTLITDEFTVMQSAADAVADAIKNKVPGIVGIHFEGPFLSKEKKGAHSEHFIRKLNEQDWALLERTDCGIRMLTVAPEHVELLDIQRLVAAGVIVMVGHSNASCQQTQACLAAGASGFTHLFNAMSQLQAREPGVVGAALTDADSYCGVIVDGHHVHAASLRLALTAKADDKIFLVTDAMAHVGVSDLSLPFFGREIIREGTRLNSSTGELAGSFLDMATAIENCQKLLGLTQQQALNMASLFPAQLLRADKRMGQIALGRNADFTLLNEQGKVIATWISGVQVV